MNKKILLVEPAYKSKYPPLGLMKLSTYHKIKRDEVVFVRGCNSKVRDTFWDRVYITTLFTYTWDETVKTIKFYRETLFNLSGKCFVGGILASLMPQDLFNATGIQPIQGLLDDPKKIDQEDNIIIDSLPPDYDVIKQVENVDFSYANTDAYLGYTTRGCVWKCEFCAVKRFEPKYIPYIDIKKIINGVIDKYGAKQNLLLMDNNVLASSQFDHIIDDIKALGFVNGATFGKTKRKRIVDFNQGLDAKFLTEEKMKRLAEIPLDPMRIAFDDIGYKSTYIKAVRLAHKYGQKNMSNYILYNFKDSPDDFYERLRINIDLNEEFEKDTKGVKTIIYSFPMRYIPLNAKNRDIDTGNSKWNKRYLRSVKIILNVTKGPVMPGAEFFFQAFGNNAEEFKAILLMPEDFIRNRVVKNWRKIKGIRRLKPYVRSWMETYFELPNEERNKLTEILASNEMLKIQTEYKNGFNKKIKRMLHYHLNQEDEVVKYQNA
jgi:hypothetical protein